MDTDPAPTETTTETESARPAQLRMPSLWSYEQLQAMGLLLFADKEAFQALPEREKNREISAFMWVHHVDHDEDAVEAAVAGGTWRDEAQRFHRSERSIAALPEVEPRMEAMKRMMGR